MSRNPYLAASRSSGSSYTRSSRTSKHNALTQARSGLLGRSRSSATLGNLASQYGSTSSYVPSSSTSSYIPSSSWQRSLSSSRANTTSSTPRTSTNDSVDASHCQSIRASRYSDDQRSTLQKSASTTNFYKQNSGAKDDDTSNDSSHLKNYQQNKLSQPNPTLASSRNRSSLQSLDSDISTTECTKQSATSLDSTESPDKISSYDDDKPLGDNIPSSSARHLKSGGQLSKSQSLDANTQPLVDSSTLLTSSMSVDRLLLRAESMGERELRKSFKDLVMENERLRQQLLGIDDRDKQKQQEWIRKERQWQRKISELEEENKQLEHWKQEIQRLKDENSSLIRVVSKLSKQH